MQKLECNKLVSIFLCVLEHFEGDMILAEGRVQTLDEAFQMYIMISVQVQYSERTS